MEQQQKEYVRPVRKHTKKTFVSEYDKRIKKIGKENKGGAKNLQKLLRDFEDQYSE